MKFYSLQAGLPIASLIGLFARAVPVPRSVIRLTLYVASLLGLFRLARYFTQDGLRIICYHGFALAEEYKYRSTLFITDDFFRRRIEYLQSQGYPILPLSEALEALSAGRLPPCATVITMDDGWRGVHTLALPIIEEYRIPVTVYVATYYVEHPMPVYTVTLSYLFWRSTARSATLPRGLGAFDLEIRAEAAEETAQKFGASLAPAERLQFLKELAESLGVSFEDIEKQQLFRMMDAQQLRQLALGGVDIQLHSHTHEWPLYDRRIVETEIAENRKFLRPIAEGPLEHFCYPSGVYGLHQGEWLAQLGVKSATTIEPGLNYSDTPRFALRRVIDGGPVSEIEFAAEMTGFLEIVRLLRRGQFLAKLREWRSRRLTGSHNSR